MIWDPDHPAIFVRRAPDGRTVALVRHDSYPYQEDWDEAADGWGGLFGIANRYLALVNKHLGLPQAWLVDLREEGSRDPDPPGFVRWLRNDLADPRRSFWAERQSGLDEANRPESGPVLDRAAVLLAGLCWPVGESRAPKPLYGGQGLRIIVQAGRPQAGPAPVRIRGVSSTLPPPKTANIAEETLLRLQGLTRSAFSISDRIHIVNVGVRLPEEKESPIVYAMTAPPEGYSSDDEPYGDDYSYEGTSFLLVMRVNARGELEPLARRPLIALADRDVYVQDPVSKNGAAHFTRLRPSRSWPVLDPEAVMNVLLGNLPPGQPGFVKLVDPDPNNDPDFRVMNSRFVDPPAKETDPKEVRSSVHDHVRTNTFAAVNAFYHTSELFKRMRAYGLAPAAYFKYVTRPIDIRYRAGIFPGASDGRTVNAQVRWTLKPGTAAAGSIEVRFALGDLQSAIGRLPANLTSAVERSPLGVATDPRWCWHEYCHVLLAAAAGDLEFGFAHSAGDAIAAIQCDPESELAKNRSGALANDGPWRGVTFPWVLIPRRHDRSVYDGWSWTGPMNRREIYFAIPGLCDKRGYWTEQILSSSLFRLYRAIGGDSETSFGGQQVPAKLERKNAADYTTYLIMRTIQMLGPAAVTSSLPEFFVDTMQKADTSTTTAPAAGGYIGGIVNKVVQWAFERQGLYGTPVPNSPVSGKEADPNVTVDLHIEDQRPKPEGPYSPVDLLGTAWHADPGSLWVTRSWLWPLVRTRTIRVKVENRGPSSASGTRVEVWYVPVTAGTIPAFPDSTKWKSLGSLTGTVPGAASGTPGATTFGPFTWNPPGAFQEYAILAAASCPDDLSNVDSATSYPCASVASPVNLLVGCDNNLGLIRLMIMW